MTTRGDGVPDREFVALETTIGDHLRLNAERFADRPALQWELPDGSLASLTYAGLLAVASATAVRISDVAAPGDRVAVWAANSPEWVVLECACALSGTILTAMNTAWADDEVRHALRLTDPRLLFVGPDNRGDDLGARATALAGDVLVVGLADLTLVPAEVPESLAVADPGIGPGAPFLIQFTSGTTGSAKGATLSHHAVINSGHLRAFTFGADEYDVWVNPVPLHHMGGSCVVVMAALTSGGCYVVMPRFDPPTMVRLMRTAGATRIGGVPTMLYALLDVPGAREAVQTVTAIGLGGTSIPPSLVERIQTDFGATVSVVYAQSECPMITSTLADTSAEVVATTVGFASPGTSLRIVGPEGVEVAPGEIGEVCVRSTLTMIGYWDSPEATAEAFDAEGFLRTGDLGSVDELGLVRIHGRAREMIIRGGENIYPIEIEDVLLRHPAVAAVAVLGVPDERWGESVGAVVQLVGAASADELEEYVAGSVAHFKVPRHWRFVDAFPLTAAGKIRKVELPVLFAPVAVRDRSGAWSFAALASRVARMAGGLVERGVGAGDSVLLVVGNDRESVAAYHAVVGLGAVAVLTQYSAGAAELRAAVEASSPVLALVSPLAAGVDLEGVAAISMVEVDGDPVAFGPVDPAAPRVVIFTSGTTSVPKGVVHSASSLAGAMACFAAMTGLGAEDRAFLVSPLASITGVTQALEMAPAVGAGVVLESAFEDDASLDLLVSGGGTFFGGPDLVLDRLLSAAAARGVAMPLRLAALGGTMLRRELLEKAEDAGVRVVRVYGSSEVPWSSGTRPAEDASVRLGDEGTPGPGVELRVDPGTRELFIRGPHRFVGYLGEDSSEDWFATGDEAEIVDGRLRIVGRLKDVANRNGKKISLAEVDAAFASATGIADCASFIVPDGVTGERVALAVRTSVPLDVPVVLAAMEDGGLARFKLPECVVRYVEPLPTTGTGKVQRRALSEQGDVLWQAPRLRGA